jgi:hypothetical protein
VPLRAGSARVVVPPISEHAPLVSLTTDRPSACAPPLAPGRPGWGRRHTAATVALTPALLWFYSSSAGPVHGVAGIAGLGLLAVMGAVTLATYLRPSGGLVRARLSPCAAAAPLQMLLAAFCLFLGADLPLRWLTAFALAGAALAQRTTGSSTCSIVTRGSAAS